MARSIKRNFIYNIILNISQVLFPLVTAPYVSRVLEPDGLGLFNFAQTLAYYFSLFAALGIPFYGIREIAKIRDNVNEQTKFVSEIMSISAVATLFSTIILFLLICIVNQLNENYMVFVIACIVLYFTPLRTDWFFSGKEEFGYIALRSLIVKTISVVLLFIVVRTKDDLIIYVALNAVTLVANDIWNFIKMYRNGIHPYFTLSGKKHIKPLLILFSSTIAISIYAVLDTLMLGFMTDYAEVGYYNCATHLSKALVPIVTSLAAVVLPRITQLKKDGKWAEINDLLNKSFSIVGFLSFPITFAVIAVSPVFVPLFFGEQFYGTILPLQIIVFTVVAIGFNNLTGIQILLGFGYDKYFLCSILSGAFSNFFLNLILIPLYGASGAAFSSVIAESVVLGVMLFFIYSHTPVRFVLRRELFQAIVLSSTFLVVAYLIFNQIEGWIGLIIVIVICTLLYLFGQYCFRSSIEHEILLILTNKIKKYKNE